VRITIGCDRRQRLCGEKGIIPHRLDREDRRDRQVRSVYGEFDDRPNKRVLVKIIGE
jgi:hypothetical protein